MTDPSTIAQKIADLIEKAPAGGIFHDANVSSVVAGRGAYFVAILRDGTEVTVRVSTPGLG